MTLDSPNSFDSVWSSLFPGTDKVLITQEDNDLNSIPGNNCRTWVLRALERLKDAGILHCSDVLALEQEVLEWGNSEQQATIENVQPRVVVRSKLCGLA